MELKHEEKLTKQEFDTIASEIRAIVGNKLKNHTDGDSERFLLKR